MFNNYVITQLVQLCSTILIVNQSSSIAYHSSHIMHIAPVMRASEEIRVTFHEVLSHANQTLFGTRQFGWVFHEVLSPTDLVYQAFCTNLSLVLNKFSMEEWYNI